MAEVLMSSRVGAAARVEPAAVAGKGTPARGHDLPPERRAPPPDLSRVAENLNRYLQDSQRNIRFRVDDGYTIVTIVDAATGETVRQIPSETMVAVARHLRQAGMLLDLYA
jgi:flagellar protein FlaG